MAQREAVIVSAVRTPFGSFGGGLRDLPAVELGGIAIREALRRARLTGQEHRVDYVAMGMVLQAGAGQIPSRQAAHRAGIPFSVPSDTINKVCASSLRAVNIADALIRAGDIDIAVAGGMESMSNAPYLVRGARWGMRMGHGELVDAMIHDGLWCAWGNVHMGVYGSEVAAEFGIDRRAQDEWALRSHQRALAAWEEGRMQEEVVPVEVPGRKGEVRRVERDESIRPDTSLEKLAALKPVFTPDGTVTAGNAPPVNDGASALVIMSREKARELGLEVLATIVSQGQVSEEPRYLHTVPARAGLKALQKAGLSPRDLALVEINEAFAAVTLTSIKIGGFDPERVNVNGGAVAIGHPIGASGGRILMTLVYELRRRGGGYGLAAICSGGGQGEATVVRVD
ncbi:acetyl-CoA C-acetyltransferase [Caldinitratiruptor microaerophilus]|uniref:Acetyl-CoA acetyltransferase n=1 Tax=Caldinitratiruptor microaerophilus TaxID=671077 RepID=A0AA35CLC8_9FIRM|nr:acetyl-CoA C-acetyltransferase [Caldinitratiruptor microaerophilus]BDG61337.1 acetyl-CoA acetyltransferase [Caldinitratiruptor microaerophilus]